MTCMHDYDVQCFEDCPNCARYNPRMCDGCGSIITDENASDKSNVCIDCAVEEIKNHVEYGCGADVWALIFEFIEEHETEFNKFLKGRVSANG